MTDAELVRRTLAGEFAAYEELVRRWAPRITALCHAQAGRGGAAEDLAQETLLRGFRALGTLAEPDKFGSWLFGIALRTCRDWLKSRQRSEVRISELARDAPLDFLDARCVIPDQEAEIREEQATLMAEVEALPCELREVLMLFYYDDLTYREMAQLLGVSSATVNARLTRARAQLRERLNGTLK
jgi:RNA polymerase sigma-70 factor (ECF subfamily)